MANTNDHDHRGRDLHCPLVYRHQNRADTRLLKRNTMKQGLIKFAFAAFVLIVMFVVGRRTAPDKDSSGVIKFTANDIGMAGATGTQDQDLWLVNVVTTNRSGARMAALQSTNSLVQKELALSDENLVVGDRVRLTHVAFAHKAVK